MKGVKLINRAMYKYYSEEKSTFRFRKCDNANIILFRGALEISRARRTAALRIRIPCRK